MLQLGDNQRPQGRALFPLVALLLLPVTLLAAVILGVESIPLGDSLGLLLSKLGLGAQSAIDPAHETILSIIRPPRVAVLALAGAALSVSGATLQATFHNSMASPTILGVTSGGAFGAVLSFHLGFAEGLELAVPICAFAGALGASCMVYFLAHVGGRPSTTSLLLTGVAVGALMGAGTALVQTWVQFYKLQEILFWLIGGARDRTWQHAGIAALPIALGALGLLAQHTRIDAMSLGEEHALSVGVAVHKTRMMLLALSAMVAGAAVSVVGPVGFVGLIVPHLVRLLVGPSARLQLPSCLLFGAHFLVLCDLFARLVSGQRVIHLGIVTAFLGVPFFLWLLIRAKQS